MAEQLVVELRSAVRVLELELRAAQAQARRAEQRAAVAEKSAREAWSFARTVMRPYALRSPIASLARRS